MALSSTDQDGEGGSVLLDLLRRLTAASGTTLDHQAAANELATAIKDQGVLALKVRSQLGSRLT